MKEDLVYVCEICQTVLEEHHCKAVCPNCGRMFDCSDLPLIQANARIEGDHLVPRPGNGLKDLLPQMDSDPSRSEERSSDSGQVANLP